MTTEELKALAEKYFDETIVYWTGKKSRPNDLPVGFGKLMDLVKEVQRRTREEALTIATEEAIRCSLAATVANRIRALLAEEDSER